MEVFGEARRHLVPGDMRQGIAVQQKQRRPAAAVAQADAGADVSMSVSVKPGMISMGGLIYAVRREMADVGICHLPGGRATGCQFLGPRCAEADEFPMY